MCAIDTCWKENLDEFQKRQKIAFLWYFTDSIVFTIEGFWTGEIKFVKFISRVESEIMWDNVICFSILGVSQPTVSVLRYPYTADRVD